AKPASMLEASPKGTVPVLVLPNRDVIEQSLDIMRWALTGCDPEAWLDRDDAALIAVNDGPFKHDLDRYKYPDRHGGDPLVHRDAGLTFLRDLEVRLSACGQLGGSARGLTDAAIMPFVRQFSAVDPDWFSKQDLPHLQRWLQGHLLSELFASIMDRPPVWRPDSECRGDARHSSSPGNQRVATS
ncbi:MAG: glutathione S-transferase, partial [Sphingomicrobium sp.]